MVGDYRKVHLKGEERTGVRAGFKFPLMKPDFGNVGLLLGWDSPFRSSAHYASTARKLLIVCANWEKPNDQEWRTYLLWRAYGEHLLLWSRANRIGHGCHPVVLRPVDILARAARCMPSGK